MVSNADFRLRQEYFEYQSDFHGILHTYRVMWLTLLLGLRLQRPHDALVACCAAYIHDMSRRHDGVCTLHGAWAVQTKLPFFRKTFLKYVAQEDVTMIGAAVDNHCRPEELEPHDPAYAVTAILKDADALDRVRFGAENLHVEWLRTEEARRLIGAAEFLFHSTKNLVNADLLCLTAIMKLYNNRVNTTFFRHLKIGV